MKATTLNSVALGLPLGCTSILAQKLLIDGEKQQNGAGQFLYFAILYTANRITPIDKRLMHQFFHQVGSQLLHTLPTWNIQFDH
jgi:hypothetical protein